MYHRPRLLGNRRPWDFVLCDGKWGIVDASMWQISLDDPSDISSHYKTDSLEAVLYEKDGFEFTYYLGGIGAVGYTGNAERLEIPESCNGYPVISIAAESQIYYEHSFQDTAAKELVLPATVKYGENYDLRGSGQFSGRMTASLCIAGAVALPILEKNGIKIATHILSVSDIRDRSFDDLDDEPEIMDTLTKMPFAVIDKEASAKMTERIKQAFKDCDSVGGVIECKITGLLVGLGLPMFDGLENVISRAIFAVPAVKGIEFGAGFSGSTLCGSEYNDRYYYDENGKVRTKTNHAGGICGGMATGMPVIFRAAFKPTPSIAKPQDTVDLVNKQNTVIAIHGRHDPCVVTRANVVVRAVTAFALLDLMAEDGYLSF